MSKSGENIRVDWTHVEEPDIMALMWWNGKNFLVNCRCVDDTGVNNIL